MEKNYLKQLCDIRIIPRPFIAEKATTALWTRAITTEETREVTIKGITRH